MDTATGPGDSATTLEQIRRRQAIAASAPGATSAHGDHYRALAELACQDVPRLLAAVEAVLKLHYRKQVPVCETCRVRWPCPTVGAITAALTGKEAGDEH
jgi:hypothetical protein